MTQIPSTPRAPWALSSLRASVIIFRIRYFGSGTRYMSQLKIGKFQVIGTLGQGAHSTILHIRRSADSKNYALKVVPIGEPEDKKYLEQARHEFEVARKFDHPNLIKIYSL